ncbi:uncharacterized protein LOC141632039 [Silene latifolia]|uniref:uncharacterized protein LOC141632039 n=1 Tax=Silene latifolia TaxID=37657 RepID=UPI003D782577
MVRRLPNKSISGLRRPSQCLQSRFAAESREGTGDLYRLVQGFEESIRDYLNRFNKEKVSIPRCDIVTAIQAFRRGLHQDSQLYKELTMHPWTTFEEVQLKAIAVMRLEEDSAPVRGTYDSDPVSRKAPVEKKCERSKPYSRSVNKVSGNSEGKSGEIRSPKSWDAESDGQNFQKETPAAETQAKSVSSTAATLTTPMNVTPSERKSNFTDQGNLDHLLPINTTRVNSADQVLPSPPPHCSRTVNVITGGSECVGRHTRAAKRKLQGEKNPGGYRSSVNLIMMETLKGMGFTEKDLARKAIPLVGFSSETKHSLGEIIIPTYAGGVNKQALDPRDESNSLNVPPMPEVSNTLGVQEIRGDQEEAKDCYKVALKLTTGSTYRGGKHDV